MVDNLTEAEKRHLHEQAGKVSTAMQSYGGSFMQKLGETLRKADYRNTQKIKETWPDAWEKYLQFYDARAEEEYE